MSGQVVRRDPAADEVGPWTRMSPAPSTGRRAARDLEQMAVDAELARESWQLGQGGSQLEDATYTR